MSTVLGKYSHLVSCDSSKLCSKEREKESVLLKLITSFLYIIIAPNVLYLSVLLVARLVASAFVLRRLEEHLPPLLVPYYFYVPSLSLGG